MKYITLLFTLLLTFVSHSQGSKADDILKKLSTKIKSLNSFYVEFSASVKNTTTGLNESEIGRGWVKGNKFHASYGSNTIISNGVKYWIIEKETKSIYESDASNDDETMNPKKLMTIWETGFKSDWDKQSKTNGKTVDVINLTPVNKKTEYKLITVYISKSNQLEKAVMITKDGTIMSYSVTKFTENPQVEDSYFILDRKKYPGYTLIKD